MNHIADNQDALLDYLYEEGDPAERLKIATAPAGMRGVLRRGARVPERARHAERLDAAGGAVGFPGRAGSSSAPASQRRARDGRSGVGRRVAGHVKMRCRPRPPCCLFVSGMAVSQLNVDYQDGVLTVSTPSAAPAPGVRNARSRCLPSTQLPRARERRAAESPTSSAIRRGSIRRASSSIPSDCCSACAR